MTSIPSKVKTLQGVFDTPKIVYRRDFVRENKLNLKELQKLTNKNKQQSTTTHQANKGSRQQQISYSNQQRAVSQQRAPSLTRSSRNSVCGDSKIDLPRSHAITQRSLSSANMSTRERCPSCSKGNRSSQHSLAGEDLIDKEIQTEDINDEEFLYHALKKCVGSEVSLQNKPQEINVNIEMKSNGNEDDFDNVSHLKLQTSDEFDNMSTNNHNNYVPYEHHDQLSLMDQRSVKGQNPRSHVHDTPRARPQSLSGTPRSTYSVQFTDKSHINPDDNHDGRAMGEPVFDHFDTYSVKSNNLGKNLNAEELNELYTRAPRQHDEMSVQSHGTQATRHSKQGSHKLGSRENLVLPRYLEREKREKAEAFVREMARDPKCPFGHTLLDEEQRKAELQQAQNRFNELVSELNHMPMTSETLRARLRKQEIEKELTEAENKIRIFSKSSVYVPQEGFSKHNEQYNNYF